MRVWQAAAVGMVFAFSGASQAGVNFVSATFSPEVPRQGDLVSVFFRATPDFTETGKVREFLSAKFDSANLPLTQTAQGMWSSSLGAVMVPGAHTLKVDSFIEDQKAADTIRQAIADCDSQIAELQAALAVEKDPVKKAALKAQIGDAKAKKSGLLADLEQTKTKVGSDQFVLTVTPDQAPLITSSPSLTRPADGSAIKINVLAGVQSMPGDKLTVTSVSQARRGSVTLNSDGSVSYTPDASKKLVVNPISSNGQPPDSDLMGWNLSLNERYFCVNSKASNLVAGAANGGLNGYLYDFSLGKFTWVTQGFGGAPLDANIDGAITSVSADGRYVVFQTAATNVVPNDTNGNQDVFLKDLLTGQVTRVNVATDGTQANFRAGVGLIASRAQAVAFQSKASNLVPDDTNNSFDVFVRDLQTQTTERVSVSSQGAQANGTSQDIFISGDGSLIIFVSDATNLVPNYSGTFPDVFLHSRTSKETRRVSAAPGGTNANGMSYNTNLSDDGRYAYYVSDATNLVAGATPLPMQLYRTDTSTWETIRLSDSAQGVPANDGMLNVSVSANNEYVGLVSTATNLSPNAPSGHANCFIKKISTGEVAWVPTRVDGTSGDQDCSGITVLSDGHHAIVNNAVANSLSVEQVTNAKDDDEIPCKGSPAMCEFIKKHGNHGLSSAPHAAAAQNLFYSVTKDDSFTYTVNDGHGGEVTGTVTITEPLVGHE